MKNVKKRILTILLATAVFASLITVPSSANDVSLRDRLALLYDINGKQQAEILSNGKPAVVVFGNYTCYAGFVQHLGGTIANAGLDINLIYVESGEKETSADAKSRLKVYLNADGERGSSWNGLWRALSSFAVLTGGYEIKAELRYNKEIYRGSGNSWPFVAIMDADGNCVFADSGSGENVWEDSYSYISEKGVFNSVHEIMPANFDTPSMLKLIKMVSPKVYGGQTVYERPLIRKGSSQQAVDYMNDAVTRGLVTPALNADYDAPTTRLEFCSAAINFLEKYYREPIDEILRKRGLAPHTFADTDDATAGAAAALKIAGGTDSQSNLFSPDEPITREQAAVMARNVAKIIGAKAAVDWADSEKISSWAKAACDFVYGAKIIDSGDPAALVFAPKSLCSHEQSIVIFNSLWNFVSTK